jgi:hypothetical protein
MQIAHHKDLRMESRGRPYRVVVQEISREMLLDKTMTRQRVTKWLGRLKSWPTFIIIFATSLCGRGLYQNGLVKCLLIY